MRAIYSSTWKALVVAHLKDDRTTLSFIDPDSGAVISSATDKDKNPSEYISGLGHSSDRVYGLYEWLYVKDGKKFPFIIVTTHQGRLMIVSVTATEIDTENGRARHLQYWTRYKKIGFTEPIYSVVGDAVGLLFCVGSTLHWEVLGLAEKKLRPMKQFKLDSPATSLRVFDSKVCALTAGHSVQVVDLHVDSEDAEISLIHSDQVTRYTGHVVEMGDSDVPLGNWPISVISTTQSGIAGVWIPWGQRNREFEVVFEGMLPTSVRRFRRGHTRPLWARVDRRRQFDTLLSTADDAEILGASLDGSVQHFSLIGMDLWRFLRLVQNLSQHSEALYPFIRSRPSGDKDSMDLDLDIEPQPFPDMMHIDGDLLYRCLQTRALKRLSLVGDGMDLFCEYLDGIDNGVHTEGFREMGEAGQVKYIELGYDILEHLFAPVL